MQDGNPIWQFGRWIARREPGSARLSWTGGEIELGIRGGRVHTATGFDVSELASRLGYEDLTDDDLLAAARELSRRHAIPETRAMGAAKEILQRGIRDWLTDPERELDLDGEAPAAADGATISITHALVELVLADTSGRIAELILPNRGAVLQRSASFLELYPPLRLSEDADLIVAGITGSVTVEDVAAGSEHDPDEVLRLEAALVATGILEASEPVVADDDLEWPSVDLDDDMAIRKSIPVRLIAGIVGVLVVIAVVIALLVLRDGPASGAGADGTGDWGVVVEMGCEPDDLQRMLHKRNLERKALRTIKADPANGDVCFRLIWGSFPSREAAEAAMADVPSNLVEEGFEPHVIEVDDEQAGGGGDLGSAE
jgi:hypothetical protein